MRYTPVFQTMLEHRRMNRALFIAAILASFVAVDCRSQSAPYPSRLVRLVNPVAPGGNQDIVARAYAGELSRALGQSFVVESRPGNSAIVGTRYVKSAPPDGYTVLTISNTFVRTPAMVADAGYDPIKDFVAISQTSDVPLVLVVNPALPVKTVKEFIALAKRKPGRAYGRRVRERLDGTRGVCECSAAARPSSCSTSNTRAPRPRSSISWADTSWCASTRSRPRSTTFGDGKLRPLAVTTLKRSAVLPEVPTLHESALPGFNDSTYNGLVAPAGTPREVIERLRVEVAKAAVLPEIRKRFAEQGNELIASNSAEEFAAFLKKQVEEFAVLARQAGIAAN